MFLLSNKGLNLVSIPSLLLAFLAMAWIIPAHDRCSSKRYPTSLAGQQISQMGKNSKVKKDVGSANGSATRGEEADGSTKEFAAAGMGLQELPAAAAARAAKIW